MPVLDVADLRVDLRTTAGVLRAVRGISFSIERGETFALVGESGSGKSMTALALLDLMPRNGRRQAERIVLDSRDLIRLDEDELRTVRGGTAAMIFQEPMTALNPVLSIGDQMTEGLLEHRPGTALGEARRRAVDLLTRCGVAEPERRLPQYPHELSGGLRQRVMIASALMTGPKLLIADEPTTALDVTVQAQILDLLRELQRAFDLAILFITHDLSLVRRFAHRIGVMYAGEIVESGVAEAVITAPSHPYTRRLIACAPDLAAKRGHRLGFLTGLPPRLLGVLDGCQFRFRCPVVQAACAGAIPQQRTATGVEYRCVQDPQGTAGQGVPERAAASSPHSVGESLLQARDVSVSYRLRGGLFDRSATIQAVRGASLTLARGEVLGLVGESGSGKSTLARVILGLEVPDEGSVTLAGTSMRAVDRRARARAVQPVFQDPYSSLNPRHTVGAIVRAPLDILGLHQPKDRARVVEQMLDRCGLPRHLFASYPAQLSGGQRQRVAIARALVSGPSLVVCDEPTSALDVSIQSQILNLLQDLQRDLGLTYLFISHNLAVVRHLADRVAVMYRGEIVESGDADQVFERPEHAYTQALLASAGRREASG
ncbi:MAG: ABC transporter ATP-binding protein [Alphaproteobacteria bacterium]|nr:ABC transporter ATP-binding protein [Alphaproteobacteria bacterium]